MRTSTSRYRSTLEKVLRSVVKVMTISDAPDYEQPWQTKGPEGSSGSGVVIETQGGLRVLTSAHVVADQVFVEVRRYGLARKFVATIEVAGHDCDLALLDVESPEFFAGSMPVAFGDLPRLGSEVLVCGFPIGGQRLSITEGVVSRIELSPYAHSMRDLLAVQIDAAINDGNSGGPVIKSDSLVGIAFQCFDEGENIGYAVPIPVVEHFLEDFASGTYRGFPALGICTQELDSPAHRRSLGLPRRVHGLMVTRVAHGGTCWKQIRAGDVLVRIDGVEIAADGTVQIREDEYIDHEYLVSRRHVGETITLDLWREGEPLTVDVRLRLPAYLVPERQYDVRPTYFIYGGLVFAPLSLDYLRTWGDDWPASAPHDLQSLNEDGMRTRSRQEVVMLQKILPDSANKGYHGLGNLMVTRVDGQRVRHMRDLVQFLEAAKGEFVRILSSGGVQIVLDRKQITKRHPVILSRFGIQSDRSDDLA